MNRLIILTDNNGIKLHTEIIMKECKMTKKTGSSNC